MTQDRLETDALIRTLAADRSSPRWPLAATVALAWLAGTAIAAAAFFVFIGLRPDIDAALRTARFDFKLALVVCLAIAAAGVVGRAGRPGARLGRWRWVLGAIGLVAVGAVAVEFATVPPTGWWPRLIGSNAVSCLTLIPILSVAPAVAVMLALRRGAPTRPGLAGIGVGLLSAASAATLYALNCTDDSPLFVFVWYALAGLLVILPTQVIARRVLRW